MASYTEEVLADSPTGFWRLNDVAGTVATDSSGNANHGTIVGDILLNQYPINGDTQPCMKFRGGYISIDNGAILGTGDFSNYTLEFWLVKPNPGATGMLLYSQRNSANDSNCNLYIKTDNIIESDKFPPTDTQFTPTTPITEADIYHIVFVENGASRELFLNGTSVHSDLLGETYTGGAITHANIGALAFTNTAPFYGYMKDVAVYNTSLSSARIQAHYNAGAKNRFAATVNGGIGQTYSIIKEDGSVMSSGSMAEEAIDVYTDDSNDDLYVIFPDAKLPTVSPAIYGPVRYNNFRKSVQKSSPSHWWKLDWNYYDDGPNARDGSLVGSVDFNTSIHSQGTGINTTNGYVSLPLDFYNDLTSVSVATFEFVVRQDVLQNGVLIDLEGNDGFSIVKLSMNTTFVGYPVVQITARSRSSDSLATERGTTNATLGEVHHVVFTIDAGNQSFYAYLDGQLEISNTNVTSMTASSFTGFHGTTLGRIGRNVDDGQIFAGVIQDAAVYERVLTPTEIANHYAQLRFDLYDFSYRYSVENDSPTHWWKLDNDYTDSGPNNRNGTAFGSPILGSRPLHTQGTSVRTSDGNLVRLGFNNIGSDLNGSASVSMEAIVVLVGDVPESSSKILSIFNDDGSFGAGLLWRDGTKKFGLIGRSSSGDATQSVDSTSTYGYGQVCHVVGVINYSAKTLRLYVNGVLEGELTGASFGSNTYSQGAVTNNYDCIGGYTNTSSPFDEINGLIHEVAIYNTELSLNDISNHYNRIKRFSGEPDFRKKVYESFPSHWWVLDSDFTDFGIFGRDGTANGSPVLGSVPLHSQGTSLLTSATNNVSLPTTISGTDLVGAPAITVECIFRPNTLAQSNGEGRVLILSNSIPQVACLVGLTATTGTIRVGGRSDEADGFLSYTTTASIAANETVYVVGILDFANNLISVYLNGVFEGSASVSFASTTWTNAAGSGSIGAHTTGIDSEFLGEIHEVILYKRALTAIEISNHYAQLRGIS